MAFKWQKNDTDSLCASLFAPLYREQNGLTRKELSDSVRVSKPTAAKGLELLTQQGLVEIAGKRRSKIGRKPVLYKLKEDSMYWLGVDLRFPDLTIALYDLPHRLMKHKDTVIPRKDQSESTGIANFLGNEIEDFLQTRQVDKKSVLGLGIGVPGIVKSGKFTPLTHRAKLMEYILKAPLENKLGITTTVRNDIDAELISEINRDGLDVEEDEIVLYFAIRPTKGKESLVSVGGSIFYKGSLYQGKRGSSGEFGHTTVHTKIEDNIDLQPTCGNPKCFEAYINAKLSNAEGPELPDEVEEVVKEKLIDLIFSFTPNKILVDLEGIPSLTEVVIRHIDNFVEDITDKWEHKEIEILRPQDTTLACSRGAAIESMRDLLTDPTQFPSFPAC